MARRVSGYSREPFTQHVSSIKTHGRSTSLFECCTSATAASPCRSACIFLVVARGKSRVGGLLGLLQRPRSCLVPHKTLLTPSAMADTNGPSDGERSLSPRIPSPASGSAAARQSLLLHLFQALNLNDRDGVASLEKSIEIAIASRHRALNDKNSPLLRLPTELIVAIGHLVMNGYQSVRLLLNLRNLRPMRPAWQSRIGNFMHTSSRLREEFEMVLNSNRVILCYQPMKPSHSRQSAEISFTTAAFPPNGPWWFTCPCHTM